MCNHPLVEEVRTEGGAVLYQHGRPVCQCGQCHALLFKCPACGILDERVDHCKPCELPGCRNAHKRRSPYCSPGCAQRAAKAKQQAEARKGWIR